MSCYVCKSYGFEVSKGKRILGFPGGSNGKLKNVPAIQEAVSTPGLGRYPGGGNDNPFQHSCLINPMDRGDWWATVHGVTKELDTTEQLTLSLSREDYSFRKTVTLLFIAFVMRI